jgi:Ca2+-binding EF-hand superfamily protein
MSKNALRVAPIGLAAVLVVMAWAGASAQTATSAQECTKMWKAADANNDGSLTGKELEDYKAIMEKVDTNKDGKISEAEFMAACQKGELKKANK